jgi:hypothetical protein
MNYVGMELDAPWTFVTLPTPSVTTFLKIAGVMTDLLVPMTRALQVKEAVSTISQNVLGSTCQKTAIFA